MFILFTNELSVLKMFIGESYLVYLANLIFFPIHPAVFCLHSFPVGDLVKNISPISKSLKVLSLEWFHFSSVAMGFVVLFFF
jgi:hypothetical protein